MAGGSFFLKPAEGTPMRITLLSIVPAMVGAFIASSAAVAGTQLWINPSGGLFTEPANWNPAPPNNLDTAQFDLSSTFTVTLNRDISTSDLVVRQGDVTLDLGGFTYSLSTAVGDHIRIAQVTGQPATLRVINGTLSDRNLRVGVGGIGTLVIDGPGAHVSLL